jgi:hypothetical protein
LLVNCARQGSSIQGRAPTVIQPGHAPPTPLISLNEIVGHAGIGNKHDFQTTAAGLAIQTAHPVIRQAYKFNCHGSFSSSQGIDTKNQGRKYTADPTRQNEKCGKRSQEHVGS